MQVETLCEFYRLSNREEIVAKPVSWIALKDGVVLHNSPARP